MRPINILDLNNAQQDVEHIAAIATSTAPTATDRMGQSKKTIAGLIAGAVATVDPKAQAAADSAISSAVALVQAKTQTAIQSVAESANAVMTGLGYAPPISYVAGISISARTQTVEYAGQVYAPKAGDLPFTTSGTFETAKFRLLVGVVAADLAAADGATKIGVSRPPSTPNNLQIPSGNLAVFVRSSAIDVREALPGNFVTDGSVDYSSYVQLILDYIRDFGGGKLLIPANLQILIGGLHVYTGTEIIAPDWTGGFVVKAGGMGINVNGGTGGTINPADNQRNIRFSGFQIRGQNAVPVFSEYEYILNLNAISDFQGEDLLIKGFQGDGIYFGSSNTAHVERHNERCRLDRVTLDGINAQNRNGISVIDGSHMTFQKLRILNTTKAGMPGGIDLEPNADAFARIRHITIDDVEIDGGLGTGIAFLLPSNANVTVPVEHITVRNAVIKNKETGFSQATNVAYGGQAHGNRWENITVKDCGTPFLLDSINGAVLDGVKCYDAPKQAQLGYLIGNKNVTLRNLEMTRCGTAETNALLIRTIDGLLIERARFRDSGITAGGSGRAMYFSGGTGANITIADSVIESPTGKTTVNIGVSGTYTLDNGSCIDRNNRFLPGMANDFKVNGSNAFTAAPAAGTWAVGNRVYNQNPAANGIDGWLCTVAGAPGTWKALSTAPFRRIVARNYAVSENFDAALYDIFSLNIQSNLALTYNVPTGGTVGQELTIRVRNGSGGAMGAITWNVAYKMSPWVNPANGQSRSITFIYDGSSWVEISRTPADIPN